MAVTTKIADFVEAVSEGTHNLGADTLQLALSNTAPGAETSDPTATGNGILANVTQISYANYTDDMTVDRVLEGVTSNEAGGTYTLDANDLTITASGGAIAPFQYIYLFNQSATSPTDALVLLIDNQSAISLADGESVLISFNAAGILTLA